MFNRLRLKLALLNAAVAGLILLAMAAMSYIFIARNIAQLSEQALRDIARDVETVNGASMLPPGAVTIPGAGSVYPYMVIELNADMQYAPVLGFGMNISESRMNELINMAVAAESGAARKTMIASPGNVIIVQRPSHSVLRLSDGRSFRYEIAGIQKGAPYIYFIFMDIRRDEQQLANVRVAFGITVLGGLLLTLLGGLFLAGKALRPVRAAWAKQRNFVADASHELRSPLAAIRCNLDVVLDDLEAPLKDKKLYWEGISEETGRMSVLVDELLLLARADSNAMVMQRKKVDIAALAANAVQFMEPLAAKKGVELKLDRDGAEAVTVTGDPARLKQVLIALMDNAVKYTPEGGSAAVSIRKAKEKVYIEVADTGIGIPKEHLGKIFERFYRVDKARERESGGYGLGLSIAQWIVQQHGGTIWVSSEEGKGSRFTVGIPASKE